VRTSAVTIPRSASGTSACCPCSLFFLAPDLLNRINKPRMGSGTLAVIEALIISLVESTFAVIFVASPAYTFPSGSLNLGIGAVLLVFM